MKECRSLSVGTLPLNFKAQILKDIRDGLVEKDKDKHSEASDETSEFNPAIMKQKQIDE